jgi:GTP-binding protein
VPVPPGTEVIDRDTGERLGELLVVGDCFLVARGGRGGKGNARFATPTLQAPRIFEPGEPGEERWLVLTLRLRSDAGLIGFPSAGKSTLISKVSSASPKIADYPFTTLEPFLGVVPLPGERSMILADVPGLIEGAHAGSGLGDRFLRHIEHTRVLVHLIDVSPFSDRDPVSDLGVINREIEQYNPSLLEKPQIVVANKIDLPGASERVKLLDDHLPGQRVFRISALTGQGLDELLEHIWTQLARLDNSASV